MKSFTAVALALALTLVLCGQEVFAQESVTVQNKSSWTLQVKIMEKGREAPLFEGVLKPGEAESFPIDHWRRAQNVLTVAFTARKGDLAFSQTLMWQVLNKVVFNETDMNVLFAKVSWKALAEKHFQEIGTLTNGKAVCGLVTETREAGCALNNPSMELMEEVVKKGWRIHVIQVYIYTPEKIDEALELEKGFLKIFGAPKKGQLELKTSLVDCPNPCKFGPIQWVVLVK